ncbi:glycine cleavage system aminomethyltransferase GcvT [Shouchella clausii]|uniref:glycine cleavage system aminomethyltransferase GcvT n=1 Tax=Shouchella TaxID=2893057 RepID=UPI0004E72B29|nr:MULTISPECIES: glycine cleavage system aminomethyltransferase GcvT [Shouchella]ALA54599.1 Aminomethyltransferase (glycine cleavage system T protein) [Shouchella clausii]MBU3230589.1 glycine cleavage system aminomethyltransferase GcvT [Shouchella clausii]MBU3263336.1 glycine cleavage system aminomethyltransferase GcvT [Shouchella clausii]MBU3505801.1 glycine cleavage system aminomethyltransferase GcvT [Shouchella clausii]MBU3536361.1 glycine cleavage system aminomethyltransferase GcvT [Shouch
METKLLRTPLYELYDQAGAKTVDFGGWELPVSFSGIKKEHHAVRNAAGLFDVSHMGELLVEGPDALNSLQALVTNDLSKLQDNQAQYNAMCTESGGTVDDLIVYRRNENAYLLVLNAANIQSDIEWIRAHVSGQVTLTDISNETALLAVQGPKALAVLQTLTDEPLSEIRPFRFKENVMFAAIPVLASRTGYTGEDGFELYVKAGDAAELWRAILAAGEPFGLLPCGLGARDTLRFEARLPLYGQELTKDISPIEAGIGFAVKTDKQAAFIGQQALKKQKEQGPSRMLVGIEMVDRGIPRTGYRVFYQGQDVGFVTSGTQSPTLGKNVGLVLAKADAAAIDTELEVEVRGKRLRARVVKTPFYKRTK